jgi:20S proteasome alpha/beta subunit
LGTPKFSVSSLEEIEFMDIQSMRCPPLEYDHRNKNSYSEQPHALTVVIGAVCQDGIVLVADKKITNTVGGKYENDGIKIYGDLGHILIGYTGAVGLFDIFRKYIVGDVNTTRNHVERYRYANVINTMSNLIKEFNLSIGRQYSSFQTLIAKHMRERSELYHVDVYGNATKLDYKAIGIGDDIADVFCKKLILNGRSKIKEFVKNAYTAIMYMERFCPGMGVGIGGDIFMYLVIVLD